MARRFNYATKFESYRNRTLFEALDETSRDLVQSVAFAHHLTFQEFREVVEASRDLEMWGEGGFPKWWERWDKAASPRGGASKERLLCDLRDHLAHLKAHPKRYPQEGLGQPRERPSKPVVTRSSEKTISGMCPVASDKTVCCNLRTIDAVENCVFGCSYCTVQTFYQDGIIFDGAFEDKLNALAIDTERFYHFGTGQASDSLAWGNRNGVLDALIRFAADHPNVLLELKTKSDNVRYFVDHDVPRNVVCSWSLNTPVVIRNEEHFTASLERRIEAARRVADLGVKVAFHFHPMVYYEGWELDYPETASAVMRHFDAEEVLFISFGSVTLIKPVIRKIRETGNPTRILQMQLVSDPHGKLTYPDEIKVEMFKAIYAAFSPWQGRVFMYLCMEKAAIWEKTFGYVYENNEEFERQFGFETMCKIEGRSNDAGNRTTDCGNRAGSGDNQDRLTGLYKERECAMAIEEGKSAPAFTLTDADGNKVGLRDFRGQNVIVYFYPKDDTPGCTKEAQAFRDLLKKIKKEDAIVLGVSPDDSASHQKFAKKYKLPFTLLSDPDKRVMTKYGAFGEKTLYGKKTVGVIRSTVWVDAKGKVKKHWARVASAEKHPAKVLEALQSESQS